jgi:pterin-4a-carbinolamine dehydratase
VAIERTYTFADYLETIAFVNAWRSSPTRWTTIRTCPVHYDRCVVRFQHARAAGDFRNRLRVRGAGRRPARMKDVTLG